MSNPYHDYQGRFTSREGQLANIAQAVLEKKFDRYWAERQAFEEVERTNQFNPKDSDKVLAVPSALQQKEYDIFEQNRIIANGSKNEVEYFINERINRPEYLNLLAERDRIRQQSELLNEEYKLLSEAFYKGHYETFVEPREKGIQALHAYEDLQTVKASIEEYKNITAPAVARLSELIAEEQKENGIYREYQGTQLNNLISLGEYESGSREWLESRQNGIGGSDVGHIIRVSHSYDEDKKRLTESEARKEFEKILNDKTSPISDEQVDEETKGHAEYIGATGRGNAWEEFILSKVASNHPELRIAHCKTSWKNADAPFQYANFDGLMTDENGHPNGIIEIKTAADSTKWGNPNDGLNAVPPQYRAQALWYCQAAGFNKGMVAVLIDDKEYREYPFTMTPELKAEAKNNFDFIKNNFIPEWNAKKDGSWKEVRTRSIRKGFSKTLVEEIRKGKADSDVFKAISVYREETPAQTKARFDFICKDSANENEIRASLRELFAEKNPATRKQAFIGIDIETSATTATRGRIIEVGTAIKHPRKEFNSLRDGKNVRYGTPKRATAVGTGWVEGHGITPSAIAKKKQFMSSEVQKETLALLESGIMVAHNAIYERGFFRLQLPGFAEAERSGKIKILDTQSLTQWLLTDTETNSLESLANQFGIAYVGAHHAGNDANFMIRALSFLEEALHKEHKNNIKKAA